MLIFEGTTGFPLAAWLRPGAVTAACNLDEYLTVVVQRLRQAWPDVVLAVCGDNGMAGPAVYEFCEREGFLYAFGFTTNAVIEQRTAQA